MPQYLGHRDPHRANTDPSRCPCPCPVARQEMRLTPPPACLHPGPCQEWRTSEVTGGWEEGGWEQAAVTLGKAGPLQHSKLKLHTPSTCSITSLRKCKFKDKVGFQESEHRALKPQARGFLLRTGPDTTTWPFACEAGPDGRTVTFQKEHGPCVGSRPRTEASLTGRESSVAGTFCRPLAPDVTAVRWSAGLPPHPGPLEKDTS